MKDIKVSMKDINWKQVVYRGLIETLENEHRAYSENNQMEKYPLTSSLFYDHLKTCDTCRNTDVKCVEGSRLASHYLAHKIGM